jgi:NAD(P)-dependent dehydrogenase (short-subunit alcohol dehydrogenase family)
MLIFLALRLAIYTMRTNPLVTPTSSRGSVVLISSTSGYFGGTSVISYISSKHGITGLLRASQRVASQNNIRLNAVAPFFTPTHITASYAEEWAKEGLLANTTEDVAWAVAQTAADGTLKGACCLVAGKMMRELEEPLRGLTRTWVGDDVADLMANGGKLFDRLGGYPLPGVRS